MEERRRVGRVDYQTQAIVVDCETETSYQAKVKNLSPIGIGLDLPTETPDLVGKKVIVVAQCLIMYANVTRMEPNEEGVFETGVEATPFSDEVLNYLYDKIKL